MRIYSPSLTGSTQIIGTAVITDLTVVNSLNTVSASITVSAVTGSFKVTGSITIQGSGSTDPYFFLIKNEDLDIFKINSEGVMVLPTMSTTPTTEPGGMYFDNTGNFYVGL